MASSCPRNRCAGFLEISLSYEQIRLLKTGKRTCGFVTATDSQLTLEAGLAVHLLPWKTQNRLCPRPEPEIGALVKEGAAQSAASLTVSSRPLFSFASKNHSVPAAEPGVQCCGDFAPPVSSWVLFASILNHSAGLVVLAPLLTSSVTGLRFLVTGS